MQCRYIMHCTLTCWLCLQPIHCVLIGSWGKLRKTMDPWSWLKTRFPWFPCGFDRFQPCIFFINQSIGRTTRQILSQKCSEEFVREAAATLWDLEVGLGQRCNLERSRETKPNMIEYVYLLNDTLPVDIGTRHATVLKSWDYSEKK